MSRDEIDDLLRLVGMEAVRMLLMSGMPGGTRTERVKAKAFAEGCMHAVKAIQDAVREADEARRVRFGLGDGHDFRPVVGDTKPLTPATTLPLAGCSNGVVVVEIGRRGPHRPARLDRVAAMIFRARHLASVGIRAEWRNRP